MTMSLLLLGGFGLMVFNKTTASSRKQIASLRISASLPAVTAAHGALEDSK
jgi:hypothetical protein